MHSQDYVKSVRDRAIAALHTRRMDTAFIVNARKFILSMPLEPRGYYCERCGHMSCGSCGRCHMINAVADEKPCPRYKNPRLGCLEWRQAYDEVQWILQADARNVGE